MSKKKPGKAIKVTSKSVIKTMELMDNSTQEPQRKSYYKILCDKIETLLVQGRENALIKALNRTKTQEDYDFLHELIVLQSEIQPFSGKRPNKDPISGDAWLVAIPVLTTSSYPYDRLTPQQLTDICNTLYAHGLLDKNVSTSMIPVMMTLSQIPLNFCDRKGLLHALMDSLNGPVDLKLATPELDELYGSDGEEL